MLSKLPRWAWVGAAGLAFVAGMVNAVGLLGFEHQSVTHVTGTASQFAVAVADRDLGPAARLSAVLLAFVTGSTFCGLIIHDNPLKLGRRYGLALLVEAGLLAAAVPLLQAGSPAGVLITSAACGLQNALAATYSGAIVRTTHLTGVLTDLGVAAGHLMVGRPTDSRRVRLHLLVAAGFVAGGVVGAVAFARLGYHALLVPSGLTASGCVSYEVYRHRSRVAARATISVCPPPTPGSPPAAGPRSPSSAKPGPPTEPAGTD